MRISILLILVVFLSFGCDQGTSSDTASPQLQTGFITFSLAANSVPPEVKMVAARLERQGFPTLSDSVAVTGVVDSIKIRFTNVPAGSWGITVEARDGQGHTRYTGKSTVTVIEGQVAQAQVIMTPTSGGDVQITIVWENPRILWTMSAENPVLKQTIGTWDQDHYYFDDPVIRKINGIYQMWYSSGYNVVGDRADTLWIAYAISADGIRWLKSGPVFFPGPAGSWRDKGAISPCVLYENGIYKMWFVGAKNPLQYQNGVGYATSLDGKTWVIDSQPVIPLSPSIGATWHPSVIKMGNLYYLYVGVSSSSTRYPTDIILMTSSDGRTWTNLGIKVSARADSPSQRSGIFPSEVIYDENRFKMFFTGVQDNTLSIGYAESVDGISWTNAGDPPVLRSAYTFPWSTVSVGFPALLRDEGKLKMWFSAITASPSRYQIGYAEQVK